MTKPQDIKQELTSLQQQKKAVGNLMMTEVLMLALLIVLLFTVDIRAVYAMGALVLFYNLCVIRPNKKRYTQRITALECLFGVGAELSECRYEYQGSLPRDTLEQAHLVATRMWTVDAVCRHSVQGTYLGSRVNISEASFAVPHSARKGDITFLGGTWIEVQLPRDTGLNVCCISRNIPRISNMLPDLSEFGLMYMPFENKKLRESAYAFTGGEDVPAWLGKYFAKLNENGAKVMLSIRNNRLGVLLDSRFYASNHKLSDTVTQQTISFNRLPENAAVLELIRIIQRNAAL